MKKYFSIIAIIVVIPILIFFIMFNQIPSQSTEILIDEYGIPILDYGIINEIPVGKQRNPITISTHALSHYDDFIITGNETSKNFLLNNADWLIENMVIHQNYSILEYNFPYPPTNMPESGWRSGMAQGVALQALVKAHEVTKDEKYLNAADLILNSFFIEVKDGGVSYKTKNDGWWYEEYSHEDAKPSRVLNGMMYALLGIDEYYKYTNDIKAKFIFEHGITSLENKLPDYDLNGYSYYDDLKTHSSSFYHQVHVDLTEQLYAITENEILYKYHNKWKSCDTFCQIFGRSMAKISKVAYN